MNSSNANVLLSAINLSACQTATRVEAPAGAHVCTYVVRGRHYGDGQDIQLKALVVLRQGPPQFF